MSKTEFMAKRSIKKPQDQYLNQVFRQSIVPMAITDGPPGTFLEVNDAFLERFGFNKNEIIGKTVVESGLVTYRDSQKFVKEVQEKGFARNILMQLRTQDDHIHFVTINTIPIVSKEKVCWLTIGTDAFPFYADSKKLQNDIIKLFDAYEDGGIILIDISERKHPSLLYANKEAKNILKKYSLSQLMDRLKSKKLEYLKVGSDAYYARKLGRLDGSNIKMIIAHKYPPNINYKHIFRELHFTPRQQEVALLAANGDSNGQIAKKLFLSEYTVKDHLKEIFRALGIHNRNNLLPKLLNLQ